MSESPFITELWQEIFSKATTVGKVHAVHPCRIEGRDCLVHAPDLARDDPQGYAQLAQYAHTHGLLLFKDRRKAGASGRRAKIVPVLLLAFGLTTAAAAEPVEVSLQFISGSHAAQGVTSHGGVAAPEPGSVSATARQLERILQRHLRVEFEDDLRADLKQLANYYAQHTEATALLVALEGEEWSLAYSPKKFQTTAKGSSLTVDSVTVQFDPRAGAQLKFHDKCQNMPRFCVASPADALLHELLHVYTMLKHTREFVAQGGLSSPLYPYEHEYQTILRENRLYRAMSRRDKQPRPLRSDHTGRQVMVSCVTCIE